MVIRADRNHGAGLSLCAPGATQKPRLYRNGCGCAGAGDWRQYRHVQRAERSSAQASVLSVARAVDDAVDRDPQPGRTRKPVGILEYRRVAQIQSELRILGLL